MKLNTLASAAMLAMMASGGANANQATPASNPALTVSITNLTQGMHFTPRLLVAHSTSVDLFEAGEAASTPLAWLAEAGVIGTNSDANTEDFGSYLEDPTRAADNAWMAFGGLLAPASTSADYTFSIEDGPGSTFTHLSLLTMLVPTNDAFAGMDSWEIPRNTDGSLKVGTYTVNLNAYDAGTELNDELNPAANSGEGTSRTVVEAGTGSALGAYGLPGMAAPPPTQGNLTSNSTATGVAAQVTDNNGVLEVADGTDGPVHIHRNVLGDTSENAGVSDLDATIHRWLNPVARMTITINPVDE
jgi:hypothetical protein